MPHNLPKTKTFPIVATAAAGCLIAAWLLSLILSQSVSLFPAPVALYHQQVLGAQTTALSPTVRGPRTAQTNPELNLTQVGPYFWGGQIAGINPADMLGEGQKLADNLGTGLIRITLAPNDDMTYLSGADCLGNDSLKSLAARPDFQQILADPQFTTVIITAYDEISFSNCQDKNYMDPAFFSAPTFTQISKEYTDLAKYLSQFNKTFIIDNWEGDNDLYCGNAYGATADNCPDAAKRLSAYVMWTKARIAGIRAAGANNVKSAVEFNNIHSLENQGLPTVLNDVVPRVNADYYSYSSYESINVSPAQTAADIDFIRDKLSAAGKDPSSLFLGEVGFDTNFLGQADAAARLRDIVNIAQQKSIPYLVVWNLIDNPSFGVYDNNGQLTPYGDVLAVDPAVAGQDKPNIAGAQGFNADTNTYTNYYGDDNQYLILYGNFSSSGNLIKINGQTFLPLYESPNQINVKLNNTRIPGGSSVQVTVIGFNGQSSDPVDFNLLSTSGDQTPPSQ
ncbi:MAG: hypothetical protein KGJ93_01860 [Patescibacteria group bacterium]|nr:hypothetical protein [Patescibacteria group bacterium]